MNYSVSSLRFILIRLILTVGLSWALENNGYDFDYCLELDYLAWFIAIEVYMDEFDWVCELLDYTENPDNTREQLLGFYNYARTEYKDLEGYPEYK